MPTPTYDLIASNVLSSSASSVTFSSIPATYRDLIIVLRTTTGSGSQTFLQFNSDTGGNYNHIRMVGWTNSTTSGSTSVDDRIRTDSSIGGMSGKELTIFQILDYSATDKHKSVLLRLNDLGTNGSRVAATAGRWASTSAITSILVGNTANLVSGDTVYLYGIAS